MNLTQITSTQLLRAYRLKLKIERRQSRLEKLFGSIIGTEEKPEPKPVKKTDKSSYHQSEAFRQKMSRIVKESWAKRRAAAA